MRHLQVATAPRRRTVADVERLCADTLGMDPSDPVELTDAFAKLTEARAILRTLPHAERATREPALRDLWVDLADQVQALADRGWTA